MTTSDTGKSGIIEEVTLNWTDLTGKKTGATALGSNKYYKAQILEMGGQFKVVFNYGRVGQAGQTQVVMCATLDAARRQLNSKVSAKIAKGYTKIEMRSERDELEKAKAKGVVVEKKPTEKKVSTRTFHKEVENLLRLMYSATGSAIAKGLSSSSGATKDAPLGNLSDKQLDKGADILEQIEKLLKGSKKPGKSDLIDLTNSYLSNIPRNIDFARKGGKLDLDVIMLDSQERLDEQRKFITLLRDAYLQKDVFADAAASDDPVEVWYDGLKCDIDPLDAASDEYTRVQRLFDVGQSPNNSNFYGKLKLVRAWKLEQQGRKSLFDAYAESIVNKKGATGRIAAWHGTRTENLLGISRSGLLMPENLPKGVYVTGKAFGMGIYHAPCWADSGQDRKDDKGAKYPVYNGALKSMNYTSIGGAAYGSSNTDRVGYMFLEEVALGVPEVHLTACWNKHRPDAGHDYIYAQAYGNPQLAHDEIVTFDESASRRTHLVEIGFK
jgi:predicted DNA-binding WGR domain protein